MIGAGLGTPFGQEERLLERGDRFILYTDGLMDNFGVGSGGECKERFYRHLGESNRPGLQDWVDALFERARALRGETPPEDDMSLLAVEYAGRA